MFSDLAIRNSRRSRKENGLFFSSLVISIVAFYIILSLSKQDVMSFLRQTESDAVDRLLTLIPVFYVMTLVILFFLIYFACKYQLERRRREFGIYLMMGMSRGKLFSLLLAEDTLSSALALVIGLPIAVLLSELISLVTAKTVGLGIIGHKFVFSLSAVIFTIIGFLAIKLMAFLILSSRISRSEIGALLAQPTENEKRQKPGYVYSLSAICGILMLAGAYYMAIGGRAWRSMGAMSLTFLLGLIGTILLFYGMRAAIGLIIKSGKHDRKLHVFTFRQIQENVIHRSTAMAISSLLILAALCCFGFGLATAVTSGRMYDHVLDYTFCDYGAYAEGVTDYDPESFMPKLQKALRDNGIEDKFSELFALRIGHIQNADDPDNAYNMDSVMKALRSFPASDDRDTMIDNFGYQSSPYLIRLSDYNKLLEAAGKSPLDLKADEAAVYEDPDFTNDAQSTMLNKVLARHPKTILSGEALYLTKKVQTVRPVTNNFITLSFALIVPDERFAECTMGGYEIYINGILARSDDSGSALMEEMSAVNAMLDKADLKSIDIEYESYLENFGRQLFYIVAASYVTIYLAIIFLVVANTVMGVQFLMNQQKTGRRYQTLVRLGAEYRDICASARKQISWFMGLPVLVAAVSSMFGVRALFTGMLSSDAKAMQGKMLIISAAVIILLCVVEYIYTAVIKRSSDRYLLTLMKPQREE